MNTDGHRFSDFKCPREAVGLYGGTSQNSLYLYSYELLNNTGWPAGQIPPMHIVLDAQPNGAPAIPGITGGTAIGPGTPWFQVRIWNSAYPSFEAAWAAGAPYEAWWPTFQMNPGPSLAYVNTTPGPNSTWIDGPIVLGWVPEPSSCELMGLGLGAILVRRNSRRMLPVFGQ